MSSSANKLAIGTVQFGLDYGVTNNSGKVQIKEVRSILEFAKNNDINVLDTAARYGNSEEVLGSADVGDFQVITKTTPLKNDVNEVIDNFYKSLKNLNKDQVYGLLVHDVGDIDNEQFDLLYRKIIELKQQGLVSKIGFSTYMPEQVDFLLENFDFDLVQLPFNIFDVRLIKGGQLQELKNKNVEVHARSIFLQGILVNDFKYWPKIKGHNFEPIYDNITNLCQKYELTKIELVIGYIKSIKWIDSVLFGVDNIEQLKENIALYKNTTELNKTILNECTKLFSNIPKELVNPVLWN